MEHYPKNRKFDQSIKKENIKEIQPEEIIQEKKIEIPLQTIQKKSDIPIQEKKTPTFTKTPSPVVLNPIIVKEDKNEPRDKVKSKEEELTDEEKNANPKKVIKNPKEVEDGENKKNPDNTNFTNETVKVIGRITHFSSNLKLNEVIEFLAKHGIDKEKCWYFITEKNNEIHLIRNNEKGFQINPFVISFIDLKIKEKLTESNNQIKIVGNNHFSIISNIPTNLYETVKNGLIALLSQTKK